MQKTKKLGHINWIKAVMIVSQLLLIAFVTYWITSQYDDEKESLRKELSHQFMLSQQEAIDTLLLDVFDPIMSNNVDSSIFQIQVDISSDTIITTESISSIKIIDSTRHFPCTSDPQKYQTIEVISESSGTEFSDEDMFIKGVNLLIQMTSDSGKISNAIIDLTDTVLLKSTYDKKLVELDWNFKPIWSTETPEDSTALYFKSSFLDYTFGVSIENYRLYIYREIIPQMLFGLILLLLTGGAFWFTFQRLKDQIALNAIRKGFISNISHELKTPVATVKVALEALQNYDMSLDPKKTDEYLKMASHEMNRLDLLVSQVMSTSLMDEGKHPFNPQGDDLKRLTNHVLQTMELRFQQKGAEIIFIANDDKYIFEFDELLIHGVITNLLDNSLKYTHETSKIKITLEQDQSIVSLSIEDNGIGIPEEFQTKIFEKFFRVPTGNKHNVKGSGLGLSYAKQVIDLHKGSISVKNIATGGCSFTISLPKQ